MTDTLVHVYIDIDQQSLLVGRLWARSHKGRESASFEYDAAWLANANRFAIDPALQLTTGAFHTQMGKRLFGALGDSAPDRWGRTLMLRSERLCAKTAKTTPRTLLEIDYLLGVDDESRAGALRFTVEEGGPYLAPQGSKRIPALIELPRLLAATERFIQETEDEEDLRLIFAPGSSLGGARPKASVRDDDGSLAIAKFPSVNDTHDTVRWEALALLLARKAGIATAQVRLVEAAERPVLLVTRFDRLQSHRIPLLSAMSMLGAQDNDVHSYTEIADALRQQGASPASDLQELWRRIVFTVLINNTDDHLRNHAFLYTGTSGWALSPAYDINPMPVDENPRVLSTAIAGEDRSASLDLAISNAGYFGLALSDAKRITTEVAQAVATWRTEAEKLRLKKMDVERLADTIESGELHAALNQK
jgi:serine/threonine-protein kinase HipA